MVSDAIFVFDLSDQDSANMSRRGGGGRRDDSMSGANNAPLGGGSGGGLMARAGSGGGGGSLLKPAYLQQGKIGTNVIPSSMYCDTPIS